MHACVCVYVCVIIKCLKQIPVKARYNAYNNDNNNNNNNNLPSPFMALRSFSDPASALNGLAGLMVPK